MSKRARNAVRSRAPGSTTLAVAGLVVLSAIGCSGDGEPRERLPAPIPGNPAPSWEGEALDGSTVSLEGLKGEVVILNVWATWCAPCIREMPGLDELYRTYRDQGLRVLGASVDRSSARRDVLAFADDLDLSFTILLDPDQRVMNRFRTLGVPETFLIDREGIIAHRWIGEFDPMDPEVLERVEALLDARPPSSEP